MSRAKSEAIAKEYAKYDAVNIADEEIQRVVQETFASKLV